MPEIPVITGRWDFVGKLLVPRLILPRNLMSRVEFNPEVTLQKAQGIRQEDLPTLYAYVQEKAREKFGFDIYVLLSGAGPSVPAKRTVYFFDPDFQALFNPTRPADVYKRPLLDKGGIKLFSAGEAGAFIRLQKSPEDNVSIWNGELPASVRFAEYRTGPTPIVRVQG